MLLYLSAISNFYCGAVFVGFTHIYPGLYIAGVLRFYSRAWMGRHDLYRAQTLFVDTSVWMIINEYT